MVLAIGLSVARAQSTGDTPAIEIPASEAPFASQPSTGTQPAAPLPRYMPDTSEYCDSLRANIARIQSRRGHLPADVDILTREGEAMCHMGHFKPGITRLRTAIMLLRHRN